MAFQDFIDSPKAYLQIHRMQINNGMGNTIVPGGMTRAAAIANSAHGTSIQYSHVANVEMVFDVHQMPLGGKSIPAIMKGKVGLTEKRLVAYKPAVGGPYLNFRFLPYSPTDVTFMSLGGADFAMTGPLQGCTLSVVRDQYTGAVWFFHANVSGGGGVTPANLLTKRTMIRNAGNTVNIPNTANYFFCEYGPQLDYHGWGFVWGRQRAGGKWKFYVHTIDPPAHGVSTIANRKWAELP